MKRAAAEVLRSARTHVAAVAAAPPKHSSLAESAAAAPYERKRCPGGSFAAMGEEMDKESVAEDAGSSVVEHWHRPVPLLPRPSLRVFHATGEAVFEDRPFAAALQQPQVVQYFEEAATEAALARPGVVVDAGANIGMFAMEVKRLYPSAYMLCIEPIPATCAVLALNLQQYDTRVRPKVLQCGVGEAAGFAEFTVRRGSSHTASSRTHAAVPQEVAASLLAGKGFGDASDIAKQYRSQLPEHVTVEIRTLADIITAHALPAVSLLKLDVEGCEAEAVRGLRRCLHAVHTVVVEVATGDSSVLPEIRSILSAGGLVYQKARQAFSPDVPLVLLWASRDAW